MIGKTGQAFAVVNNTNTAKTIGSGNLDVFGTPAMIALMERAACNCLEQKPGQSSVGVHIDIEHIAASPLGAEITATATITGVEGRKISFNVSAFDNKREIGKGTHTRFIIDTERFMDKLNK